MGRPRRNLRDQILTVAEEHFFRDGFSHVALSELVAQLKTSKSAFYRYFANKQELVFTVAERLNETINVRLGEIIRSERSFDEKLTDVMRFTVAMLRRVGDRFLRDLEFHAPEIWERYLVAREERVRVLYSELFRQGRQTGELRSDLPLESVVNVYLKLTELVVSPPSRLPIGGESSEVYQTITTLFLEGAKPHRRLPVKHSNANRSGRIG